MGEVPDVAGQGPEPDQVIAGVDWACGGDPDQSCLVISSILQNLASLTHCLLDPWRLKQVQGHCW